MMRLDHMEALSSFTRLSNLLMLGNDGQIGRVTEQGTFLADPSLTRCFSSYVPAYLREYANNPDDRHFRVGLVYHSRRPKPWGAETLLFSDAVVKMLYPVNGPQRVLTAFQRKKRENSVYYGVELLLEFALKDNPGALIFLPALYNRGTKLGEYSASFGGDIPAEDADIPVIEVLNLMGPPAVSRTGVDVFAALHNYLRNTIVKKDVRRPVEMKLQENKPKPYLPFPECCNLEMFLRGLAGESKITPPAPTVSHFAPEAALAGEGPASDNHIRARRRLVRFMTDPCEYADPEMLKHFTPFRQLESHRLKQLARRYPVYEAPAGSRLLKRGTSDRWNIYLLEGEVQLTAADGESKTIIGGTENSRNPIAALKPRKFSVTAISKVRFLWIDENTAGKLQQESLGMSFHNLEYQTQGRLKY